MQSIVKKTEPCPEEIIGKEDRETLRDPKDFFDVLVRIWVRGAVMALMEDSDLFICKI